MGTRLQDQTNRILNAMDEAKVDAVIQLERDGRLIHPQNWGASRYEKIREACVYLNVADVDYWLDEWFKIPKTL